ncbi:glycosyltransferase family 4 protein [Carboxylicivirga linearis]|uniref:Glycosyltransferase family 4 protein n=1 Tax=Carboxylicivirga linearis TaxID=1628157 RepID=A0ABS5JUE3_9BACT|nr:glycosyltransferase family 1 protein [Carboxylicivirga linearis]MBS2098534.1 glycosyltransferase family 4 protein [Carboxylicivirga linearis]
MKITYYQRRPLDIHYSLEQIFDNVRAKLPEGIESNVWVSPYFSKGLRPRIRMIFAARKFQGDINHITGDINFIAIGLKKQKTILTIHDLGILNNTKNPLLRWILKTFWITLPVKYANAITVVSDTTKTELLSMIKINADKVKVIGNFIPDSFKYNPKKFNSEKPRILHIGSAYNKNLDRLIEAVKNIKCHLVIIGFPTLEQKESILSYNISHEILSGISDEELLNQYQKCDLLSFVSLLEGFGLPILEAQATGRPVLTSNLSSMPEVAGKGACLVDPYDIRSIESGIKNIINNEHYRQLIIERGLINIKRFSLGEVTNQYINLYYEIYSKI